MTTNTLYESEKVKVLINEFEELLISVPGADTNIRIVTYADMCGTVEFVGMTSGKFKDSTWYGLLSILYTPHSS